MNEESLRADSPASDKLYRSRGGIIIEIATGMELYKIAKKHVRTQILSHLNNGGGFAGFTPMFIAREPIIR